VGLPFFLQIFQIFFVTCDRKQTKKSEKTSRDFLHICITQIFQIFGRCFRYVTLCRALGERGCARVCNFQGVVHSLFGQTCDNAHTQILTEAKPMRRSQARNDRRRLLLPRLSGTEGDLTDATQIRHSALGAPCQIVRGTSLVLSSVQPATNGVSDFFVACDPKHPKKI
jgi:hypothetical protein